MSPRATGFRVKSLMSQRIGRDLALAILMILFSCYLEEDTVIKRGIKEVFKDRQLEIAEVLNVG